MTQYTVDDMMKAYSEDALELANQMGTDLNFSEESLRNLDEILEQYHQGIPKGLKKIFSKGPSEEQIAQMSKIWGGYLGEVIKKHLGGEWGLSKQFNDAIALLFDDNSEIYPPAKVSKRILNGREDNVCHFYQAIKKDHLSSSR